MVLVLANAVFEQIEFEELWLNFGTGKIFKYIAAHDIFHVLGSIKSKSLHEFHASTGCVQIPAFASKDKKTAWEN